MPGPFPFPKFRKGPGNEVAQRVIRVIFLDFRKAFDLINQNILLENMRTIGIRQSLIKWFATYLKNRSHFATVGKDESEYQYVNGGVPQGSKVGPIAFVIKINQLPSVIRDEMNLFLASSNEGHVVIEDETIMFMDDTTMFEVLDVTGHISGTEIGGLPSKVNKVKEFADEEKMEMNLKKCKEMIIDFRRNKTIIPPILIDSQQLERVTAYKLLGLWVDDDLKWKSNVEYLVKKAAKRLFLLKVLKSYNAPVQDLKLFYTSVIRSILEYCAQVWHGNLTKDQSRDLERIQKRAVRIIFPGLTFDEV